MPFYQHWTVVDAKDFPQRSLTARRTRKQKKMILLEYNEDAFVYCLAPADNGNVHITEFYGVDMHAYNLFPSALLKDLCNWILKASLLQPVTEVPDGFMPLTVRLRTWPK
jgi:hypothetical protein